MKKLYINAKTSAIYLTVNDAPVTLKAFIASKDQYESFEYLEKEFKNYLYNPKSAFRKSLPFNRMVDLNMSLKGKDFLTCLEILQRDFGLTVSKKGLPYIEYQGMVHGL